MDDQNIETEVDRYIAWPAQALSYKKGQMKILEMRARAQRELGAKFDLRAFHDAVQDQAPLPLDVLEGRLMLGLRRGSEGVVGAGDLRRLLPGWPSFWRNQPLTREDRETTDWLEQMKNMPDKS